MNATMHLVKFFTTPLLLAISTLGISDKAHALTDSNIASTLSNYCIPPNDSNCVDTNKIVLGTYNKSTNSCTCPTNWRWLSHHRLCANCAQNEYIPVPASPNCTNCGANVVICDPETGDAQQCDIGYYIEEMQRGANYYLRI